MDNIFNDFKIPLNYLNKKHSIKKTLLDDLELIDGIDDNTPIYNYIFNPTNDMGKLCIKEWGKHYTTNKSFLKESQKLYKNINGIPHDNNIIQDMVKSWKNIKNETSFYNKYNYIEWDKLKFLNDSSKFLTLFSFYNIVSPILHLTSPLFIFIFPFIILKMLRIPITIDKYKEILIQQLKNHSLGRLYFNFNNVKLSKKIYLLFCVGMYIYNFYQNILSCIRFYKNILYINNQFVIINNYLKHTLNSMRFLLNKTKKLKTYKLFNKQLNDYINKIEGFYIQIQSLPKPNEYVNNIKNIGSLMKQFYIIYNSIDIDNIINFTYGYHGYVNNIVGINNNINNGLISKVKFTNKNNKFKMDNVYYPAIKDNIVKNNINFKNNSIITGPNAAGKTTIIKSCIINLLFSQQIGYGYFDKACINPYHFIHSYINIPDSCSRDSLFQSEAKRCKNILDIIHNNNDKRHFCIFDELYSGTNPYEAIATAYGYLKLLSSYDNVKFILTTHFLKLCKLFSNNDDVINYNMETSIYGNNLIKFNYKIINGISNIKGGVSVLKQLKYPNIIIDVAENILKTL